MQRAVLWVVSKQTDCSHSFKAAIKQGFSKTCLDTPISDSKRRDRSMFNVIKIML
jgi:hypothetical protein